jgi:hypothetical protein
MLCVKFCEVRVVGIWQGSNSGKKDIKFDGAECSRSTKRHADRADAYRAKSKTFAEGIEQETITISCSGRCIDRCLNLIRVIQRHKGDRYVHC